MSRGGGRPAETPHKPWPLPRTTTAPDKHSAPALTTKPREGTERG